MSKWNATRKLTKVTVYWENLDGKDPDNEHWERRLEFNDGFIVEEHWDGDIDLKDGGIEDAVIEMCADYGVAIESGDVAVDGLCGAWE